MLTPPLRLTGHHLMDLTTPYRAACPHHGLRFQEVAPCDGSGQRNERGARETRRCVDLTRKGGGLHVLKGCGWEPPLECQVLTRGVEKYWNRDSFRGRRLLLVRVATVTSPIHGSWRLKAKLTCGAHTSVRGGRAAVGVLWGIRNALTFRHLCVGPTQQNTYIMVSFKLLKNYNGNFLNRRIVMVYFRTSKIAMA